MAGCQYELRAELPISDRKAILRYGSIAEPD